MLLFTILSLLFLKIYGHYDDLYLETDLRHQIPYVYLNAYQYVMLNTSYGQRHTIMVFNKQSLA